MSYTELESGYQDLRQQSSAAGAASQNHAAVVGGNTGGTGINLERTHQRPGFFVGHHGNVIHIL